MVVPPSTLIPDVSSSPSTRRIIRDRRLLVEVRSVTKDSLNIGWKTESVLDGQHNAVQQHGDNVERETNQTRSNDMIVLGYNVKYQAVGSTFVQYSGPLLVSVDGSQLNDFLFPL